MIWGQHVVQRHLTYLVLKISKYLLSAPFPSSISSFESTLYVVLGPAAFYSLLGEEEHEWNRELLVHPRQLTLH